MLPRNINFTASSLKNYNQSLPLLAQVCDLCLALQKQKLFV
jgi:hypothetical protein